MLEAGDKEGAKSQLEKVVKAWDEPQTQTRANMRAKNGEIVDEFFKQVQSILADERKAIEAL
jgi:hypothetical protein